MRLAFFCDQTYKIHQSKCKTFCATWRLISNMLWLLSAQIIYWRQKWHLKKKYSIKNILFSKKKNQKWLTPSLFPSMINHFFKRTISVKQRLTHEALFTQEWFQVENEKLSLCFGCLHDNNGWTHHKNNFSKPTPSWWKQGKTTFLRSYCCTHTPSITIVNSSALGELMDSNNIFLQSVKTPSPYSPGTW